jgi:hypothetical protein
MLIVLFVKALTAEPTFVTWQSLQNAYLFKVLRLKYPVTSQHMHFGTYVMSRKAEKARNKIVHSAFKLHCDHMERH